MGNLDIKTLTPLWTGGVGGKVDRIHETGLLGSMRWWYEALVRGLGGEVHGGPGLDYCNFKADQYRNFEIENETEYLRAAGLCDVCQIFGATGWKRRFYLSIVEKDIKNEKIQHPIKAIQRKYTNDEGKERIPTWYFPESDLKGAPPNTPKTGTFEMQIQSRDHRFSPDIIGGLIQFIADWGALGARSQMGFGIIEPVNGPFDTRPLYRRLVAASGSRSYAGYPSLKNIFWTCIRTKKTGKEETFNLKYDLRRLFSDDPKVRHFVMGTSLKSGERMASKVKISRPYGDGRIRIWGWIPEKANCYGKAWDRNRIVERIYRYLTEKYNLEFWREMDNSRDSVTPNTGDARRFLQSLLGIKEG